MSEAKGGILVVEDEPLIALMIEDMASDLGWKVEWTAHTEATALEILETHTPTLAFLDINLGQRNSLLVAEICRDRGISVVFTTGYTAKDIPPECGNAPVLPKPFSSKDFAIALQRGLAQRTETAFRQTSVSDTAPPQRF